jgi:hypothetical protein
VTPKPRSATLGLPGPAATASGKRVTSKPRKPDAGTKPSRTLDRSQGDNRGNDGGRGLAAELGALRQYLSLEIISSSKRRPSGLPPSWKDADDVTPGAMPFCPNTALTATAAALKGMVERAVFLQGR